MVEHESNQKEDMHSMHDEPLRESELEVHVEPMMVEDEKPYFGPTIDEEKVDV